MLTKIKTAFAAVALSMMASLSTAATLDLLATSPVLTAADSSVDYLELGGGEAALTGIGDVSGSTGIALDGAASIFFDVIFETAAPNDPVFGTVDVTDTTGAVVEGDFVGFGFTDTTLELLFDVFGGRFETDFGTQVLVEFTLAPGSGTSLLSGLADGDVLSGSVTIGGDVAPVPLPAGLPLLLVGLASFWLVRRDQTA